MKKQIAEIINQHLPAQVAGEMRNYIDSIEGLRKDLEASEQEVENLQKVIVDYRKQEAKFKVNKEEQKRLEDWALQLDARQTELDKREDRVNIEVNNVQLAMMQKNMDNMQKLVEKVFGHPNVQIHRNQTIPIRENGMQYSDYGTEDETRTESKK